jgi:hypothetical protein
MVLECILGVYFDGIPAKYAVAVLARRESGSVLSRFSLQDRKQVGIRSAIGEQAAFD